jgi:hypothetical protein
VNQHLREPIVSELLSLVWPEHLSDFAPEYGATLVESKNREHGVLPPILKEVSRFPIPLKAESI